MEAGIKAVPQIYIHEKTGKKYIVLAKDLINKSNGEKMILYCREGESQMYCRNKSEFYEKFCVEFGYIEVCQNCGCNL